MKTNELINNLSAKLVPVKVIKPLSHRFFIWLITAFAVGGGFMAFMGPRHDFFTKLGEPWFLAEFAVLIAIFVLASLSSLRISVPGDSKGFTDHSLSLILLALWAAIEISHWGSSVMASDPSATTIDHHSICGALVIGIGLVLYGPLFRQIKNAAPLEPFWCGLLTSAGCAAMGALAMQVICPSNSTVHVTLWHFLPAVIFIGLGSLLGKMFFDSKKI